jgi:hypothetical protein
VPIITDAEKIQLVLETLGIEGIKDGELAYDRLEKQIREVEKAEGTLLQQAKDLTSTEYELVAATDDGSRALREKASAAYAASQAVEKTVVPAAKTAALSFKDMTTNTLMAERALTALATGHGIARVGPMLEKIIGSAGGAGGVGMGIAGLAFALEVIGPKVKPFLDAWLESAGLKTAGDEAKVLADELERALKAAEGLEQTATMAGKKTEAGVKAAITERGAPAIEAQVELGLAKTTALEEYMTPQELERYQALPKEGLTPEFVAAEQEKILVKARAKRAQQARAMVGQLPTDRASRDMLRAMAKQAPGVFGRGFLTELDLAEPEAQAAMKQEIKSEEAAGRDMQTTRDKMKKDIKAREEAADTANTVNKFTKEADARQAKDAQKAEADRIKGNNDAARITRQVEEKQAKEAARAKAHADREAARAATPAGQRAAERQFVEAQVGAVNQANIAQGGQAATPGFLQDVTQRALANVDAGADIASAIQNAIWQTQQKIMRDVARGLQPMAQQGAGMQEQMNGMQMFNAPGMWR